MCNVKPEDRILLWNVGIDCNLMPRGNVDRIEVFYSFVIKKESKRDIGIVIVENSKLVIV